MSFDTRYLRKLIKRTIFFARIIILAFLCARRPPKVFELEEDGGQTRGS